MARKTQITLRASSAQTKLSGNEEGSAQQIGQSLKSGKPFTQLTVVLNLTALASADVGDTLDVYIDTSHDGGTTWMNLAHFTQILGNGSIKKQVVTINGIAAAAMVTVTADAASGAVRDIGFFDTIRYRSDIAYAGSNASFTWTLDAFVK